MNLLETILSDSNSGAIGQIAKQLGLPEDATKKAVSAVSPALTRGLERNTSKPEGLGSLLDALKKGNHAQYIEKPETIGREEGIADGNAILGHIFGSKDVSRNVAGNAARETGIDPSIIKKMLPMLGTVMMGALSKQSSSGGQLSGLKDGKASGDPLAMLTGFLDSNKDGSATDDILNLAKKYF